MLIYYLIVVVCDIFAVGINSGIVFKGNQGYVLCLEKCYIVDNESDCQKSTAVFKNITIY